MTDHKIKIKILNSSNNKSTKGQRKTEKETYMKGKHIQILVSHGFKKRTTSITGKQSFPIQRNHSTCCSSVQTVPNNREFSLEMPRSQRQSSLCHSLSHSLSLLMQIPIAEYFESGLMSVFVSKFL